MGHLFCRSNEEERFVPWGYFSHLRWIGLLPIHYVRCVAFCDVPAPWFEKASLFVTPYGVIKGSSFWRTLSKRSQNAQSQNELCVQQGSGYSPQQAEKRVCINTRITCDDLSAIIGY